jgi:putative ABC transport system permease protein
VANLLLVRAAARKKLIAIRVALGAPRGRIVQQLLTESVLLGLLGGALGLGIATQGVRLLVALGPGDIPLLGDVTVDRGVLLFTAGISVAAGLLFGLVPALQFSKPHLTEALREGGQRSAGLADRRAADVLVVSQVALALMLLIGAGLLVRSFQQLMDVDPGFDPESVLTLQLELPMSTTYPSQEERDRFFRELLERIDAVPGVESSTMTNAPPMGEGGFTAPFSIAGITTSTLSENPVAHITLVEPNYFHTMGIPLLAGRSLSPADARDAPGVAIINQTLARRYWPEGSPIGARLRLSFGAEVEIIAVAGDVPINGLGTDIDPTVYWPASQMGYNFMTVIARTSSDPRQTLGLVRNEIKQMDPELPIYNIHTLEDLISGSVAQRRFQMVLVGSFSTLAVILAVIGIYGVISYSVSRRTNEIGIRLALGARSEDASRIVFAQGARLAGTGLALGTVVSLIINRFLENFVFGVKTTDPVTYLVAVVILGAVALTATYLPARRAGRVDPMVALRAE